MKKKNEFFYNKHNSCNIILYFIECFKNKVKSITLIDIPNQKGSISKEEFKNKLDGVKEKINLSNSIEESIQSMNSYKNNICLITGTLYLVGEVLNLN